MAKRLSEENKDVVLIDSDENLASVAMSKIDCIAFHGNGTSLEDLNDAGIESADAFVALTGDDEINLVACAMVNHEFSVPLTIASIRNISYTGSSGSNSNLLGISHIVNTDFEVASTIYEEIEQGVFTDVISFQDSKLVIYNLVIGKDSVFANNTVIDFKAKIDTDCLIVAINRNNESLVPSGSTKILVGDTISLVLKPEESSKALQSIGRPRAKPKKILILGATPITRLLLHMFPAKEWNHFAVIDRDTALCSAFAREFPDLLVVNGNITDEDIFIDEDLGSFDLMIALTENDELNVIVASYCKQAGIDYSMAVIKSNNNYIRLARHMGIDSIVSAQEVTVDSVTRFLHGKQVASLHSLFDGKIEVFEYMISEMSHAIGKKLKNINMQGRGVVAGVTKPSKKTIIPNGNYEIENGDILLLISKRESAVSVTRMFD